MIASTILEKHWINFRLSLGLPYEPMSDRAKEHFILAMVEYANEKQCRCTAEETTGSTTADLCNICGLPLPGQWCNLKMIK